MNEFPGDSDETCPLNQQAVGRALHALEPDEEMAVLLHLPQCRSCQAAERAAEEVMYALGSAVQQVDPPPALRESLLGRAAETPQGQSAPRHRHAAEPASPRPFVPTPAPTQNADEAPTPVVPLPRLDPHSSRGSWISRRGRTLVAASLVLAAVLSIGGLAVRATQMEQQRDAQAAQAQSATDLIQRLGRPGTQHALLATDAGTTVAAVLVSDGERQVVPVGLPANTGDRDVYVLWGLTAADRPPQPLGAFDVVAPYQEQHLVGTTSQGEDYTTYAITLEPGRALPAAPTTGVLAAGEVVT